jgi:hypothetical protein
MTDKGIVGPPGQGGPAASPDATEEVSQDLAARVAGSRWADPEWWLGLGVCLSLLLGFGTAAGGVVPAIVAPEPLEPVWWQVGAFLFLTAFYGIFLSGAAMIVLVAPFGLWKVIADERNRVMWRTRAAISRHLRDQQGGEPTPPHPGRRDE